MFILYTDTLHNRFIFPLGKSLICWKIGFSAKECFSSKSLAFQEFRFLFLDLQKVKQMRSIATHDILRLGMTFRPLSTSTIFWELGYYTWITNSASQ